MGGGWIKIHRSILDDELYLAEKFTRLQAWLDLLLLAEYKPKTISVRSIKVEIGRGQLAISIRDLAARWQWGVNKVQSFLKELERRERIETLKSHTINIIAICNYEMYQRQSVDTQTDTQTDTQGNTKIDTQPTSENNGGKREKKPNVDTQTDTQTDTQGNTKIDTQPKEKVSKKKYIEEIKEDGLGEVASADALAPPPTIEPPKRRKTKEEIREETERRRKSFYNSLIPYVETYGKQMVRAFYDYWSELNKSQTKMKWELQKTWELDRRLATWDRKDSQFNSSNNGTGKKISPTASAGVAIIANQRATVVDDIAKADELYYKQQ